MLKRTQFSGLYLFHTAERRVTDHTKCLCGGLRELKLYWVKILRH